MQWAKAHGCHTYDLWGLPREPREDDPLWGVYRFKQGFSPRIVAYAGTYDRVLSPARAWLWRHLFPLARRVVPGL
jgi:lipid II:glycine glycyltransferase (peptidoglycan interpeptide bridge formation enzyme)